MTLVFSATERDQNLASVLQFRASTNPQQLVYTYLDDSWEEEAVFTAAALDRKARAIAASLQEMGKAGDRALLLYPPGIEFAAAFFGCLYAGIIAVPTTPPHFRRTPGRLQAIVADSQATIALTTSHLLGEIENHLAQLPYLAPLKWKATDLVSESQSDEWQETKISSDDIAFLQYTSGSTSTPKGVMVAHSNLMHNLSLMQQYFRLSSETIAVSWLPAFHDMGLIGKILLTPFLGSQLVLMSPVSFTQRPVRWLQAISRYKATYSGGPNFAYEMCVKKCKPEQLNGLDLSTWRVALNGAEPVRLETLRSFAERFEPFGFPADAFMPGYGLAEGTLYVSAASRNHFPMTVFADGGKMETEHRVVEVAEGQPGARALIGCGHVFTDQQVIIVDPESFAKCEDQQIGEIWVSGRSVAKGYWNHPDKTTETFGAHVQDSEDGPFLRTGDLGFIKDGELFVTGRIKDLIIIRGRNHYPQDIELTVQKSNPAIREEFVAAFSIEVEGEERVVVVAELNRDDRPRKNDEEGEALLKKIASDVRRAVAEVHELQLHQIVLIKTGTIPKTSSGKIQRQATKAQYKEDRLEAFGCF